MRHRRDKAPTVPGRYAGSRRQAPHVAATEAGEIVADIDAYELMRAIGNLCVGAENNPRYDARRMVELLITGLGTSAAGPRQG